MSEYLEIEFKYNANDIKLTDFIAFCSKREPLRTVDASGYDYFYQNAEDEDAFCRLRVGADMNQLTFKRKTTGVNNYVRTEHNVDLARTMTKPQMEAFLVEHSYKFNTSIFKNCFVYAYDYYTLVYYICYDTDLKELGRFVELEMKEDYAWASKDDAYASLVALERLCSKELGISPQARVRRSLFEMYRSESK